MNGVGDRDHTPLERGRRHPLPMSERGVLRAVGARRGAAIDDRSAAEESSAAWPLVGQRGFAQGPAAGVGHQFEECLQHANYLARNMLRYKMGAALDGRSCVRRACRRAIVLQRFRMLSGPSRAECWYI